MMMILLSHAFQDHIPDVTFFCSSDVGHIESGKKWFDQIIANLKKAKACVTLITPQSLYFSPWVTYEAGAAYLHFELYPSRSRLFPVCAYGITPGVIPSPFRELQVRNLADPKEILTLCRELANVIGCEKLKTPRRTTRDVVAEASDASPYWAHVSRALVAHRQASSPFSFDALLKQAKTDVFCAGFNLYNIATTPSLKKALFEFLKVSPDRSVRLLISDYRKRAKFAAWQAVGEHFLKDLAKSVQSFRTWRSELKKRKLKGTLDIRCTSFVPLTIVCVDPESSDAQLVVTPIVLGRPLGVERPHFWLSRRYQPAVFAYYWDSYHDLFRRARAI
jgi:hypothetical protein